MGKMQLKFMFKITVSPQIKFKLLEISIKSFSCEKTQQS